MTKITTLSRNMYRCICWRWNTRERVGLGAFDRNLSVTPGSKLINWFNWIPLYCTVGFPFISLVAGGSDTFHREIQVLPHSIRYYMSRVGDTAMNASPAFPVHVICSAPEKLLTYSSALTLKLTGRTQKSVKSKLIKILCWRRQTPLSTLPASAVRVAFHLDIHVNRLEQQHNLSEQHG